MTDVTTDVNAAQFARAKHLGFPMVYDEGNSIAKKYGVTNLPTLIVISKTGKLVAIAIASPERSPELPDVPTVAESGLPGFEVTSWYGIVTRAGTSPAIIAKVQHDMAEALAQPDVRAKLANVGLEPVGSTPDAFAAMIKAESQKWGDIVRKAHITVE